MQRLLHQSEKFSTAFPIPNVPNLWIVLAFKQGLSASRSVAPEPNLDPGFNDRNAQSCSNSFQFLGKVPTVEMDLYG